MRVEVAMVATRVRRDGLKLRLVLFRASGELVVKIWRDKDRGPETIKEMAEEDRRRNDRKGKENWPRQEA